MRAGRKMRNRRLNAVTAPPVVDHTEIRRQPRIFRKAMMFAQARAELEAGFYATSAEVEAWTDSIGTNLELPVPYPHQPRR